MPNPAIDQPRCGRSKRSWLPPLLIVASACTTPSTATNPLVDTSPAAAIAERQAPSPAAHASSTELSAEATSPAASSVAVMPYLWAAGIAGDVSVGATSGATIDADFDDILENLEAGLMLAGEVHFAGGFGLLADVTWMDLAGNASGPLGARSVHGTTEMLHAQLSAMWRLEPQAGVGLDFLTGVRLVDIEAGLDTSSIAASVSETLIDPVVGLRLTVPIGDRFQAQAYGDVGGFGVGTDLSYQLYATLEWKLSRAIGLEAGWRHLGIDFDEPELAMDVVFSGPLLGMRITL